MHRRGTVRSAILRRVITPQRIFRGAILLGGRESPRVPGDGYTVRDRMGGGANVSLLLHLALHWVAAVSRLCSTSLSVDFFCETIMIGGDTYEFEVIIGAA